MQSKLYEKVIKTIEKVIKTIYEVIKTTEKDIKTIETNVQLNRQRAAHKISETKIYAIRRLSKRY